MVSVLCAPWSPAGPRKSLYLRCVLLFVGALLSWLSVLANRRILVVIGGGLVCSVVAVCFALRWCIAFLAACVSKSSHSRGDWWRFCVLRGRRRGPENRWILRVVLLFVGALLSWRPVLSNRRILGAYVVAGGPQNIAVH